jgi:hypothetical protein
MKRALSIICALFIMVAIINCQTGLTELPVYKGPYLGQTPPEDVPIKFLPEIFINIHSSPVFSPDGKQVYWRSMNQKSLLYMEEKDGIWCKPKSVSFSSFFYKQDVPFFSNDGKRLYFITTKSQRFYQLWSNETIWFVEKDGDSWSSTIQVSEHLNKINTHWQFSVAANGNIYLSGKENDRWYIFNLEFRDGKYSKPFKVKQPQSLANGESSYLFPCIAPDESYLIFSKKIPENNEDLFITYRKQDGSWTEEINLGKKINSKGLEICPIVSPDGNYLFYLRRDFIMWVSTKFIEDLRPKQ